MFFRDTRYFDFLGIKMIRKAVFFCLFVLTGFVYASSYSLQIIQHDENNENINSLSYAFEDGIMDYFFNSGNVISNTPIVAVKNASEDEHVIDKAIMTSLNGYCDVMIAVILEFSNNERMTDAATFSDLEKVEWFVMDLSTEKKIADGTLENTLKDLTDTKKSISKFTTALSKDIVSCLGNI